MIDHSSLLSPKSPLYHQFLPHSIVLAYILCYGSSSILRVDWLDLRICLYVTHWWCHCSDTVNGFGRIGRWIFLGAPIWAVKCYTDALHRYVFHSLKRDLFLRNGPSAKLEPFGVCKFWCFLGDVRILDDLTFDDTTRSLKPWVSCFQLFGVSIKSIWLGRPNILPVLWPE